jgi:predicted AlkP superfamily phosphohydrolase/phosphomutase
MITGMLTPPGAREFTYPPGLAASLGNYTIDLDYLREGERFRVTGFPPPRQLIADIRHMTGIRGQTCLRLMQEWEWDFLMVVFTGIDRVSHFFWEHLQGRRTPASEDSIGDEVQSYLSGLDTIIGRLVKQVGQSATIIVMSDHGFGPAPKWRLHLNIWLEKIGLLHLREGVRNFVNLEYLRIKMGRNRPLKALLQRFVPQQVQEAVEGATQEMRYDFIDWSRTLAYYVPLYFHVCGIEVNLRGRNREGVVSFGQEYEVLLEKIIAEAKRLMDHQNGARIVREVYRREELYNGPRTADFPDIILVLDPFYSGAGSLAGTRVIEPILRPTRSGDHRREGVFIAAGPWVRPRANLAGLRLLDVPPTLLYLLGVPIPPSFEGRVLEEIFQPEFLDAHPVVHSARPSSRDVPVDSSPGYTEKEERLLEGRLRGLGYLD